MWVDQISVPVFRAARWKLKKKRRQGVSENEDGKGSNYQLQLFACPTVGKVGELSS